MNQHAFGPQWWDEHYRGHPAGHDMPSSHLVAEVADLAVGTALDAGCGRGADALWLAARGWRVTAVDVSPTAVREASAAEGASRVSWVVADLTTWEPPERYDLVVSQYVHPTMPFGEFAGRLGRAVAPGGTLLVVGHDHGDEHAAAHAPADAAIGAGAVTGALAGPEWTIDVAESRTRQIGQVSIRDVVVKARRAAGQA